MRILIEARRERNERAMVELKREKFEMMAARKCLKYLRFTNDDLRPEGVSEGVSKRVSGREGKMRRDTDDARARRHCRKTWYLGI